MSAAVAVGGGLSNPFRGAAPVLRSFRTKAEQTHDALRSFTGRIKDSATRLDGLGPAAGQGATALRRVKADADSAARSVTKAGRTATTATTGVRQAGDRVKRATKAVGGLKSALGGVLSLLAGLLDLAGPLGGLMDKFGTAMTIGSGVMLVIDALTRANPIGFVTGLVLPLAGWLLDLAMNSETGQRLMQQLAKLVLTYVQGYLKAMTPVLKVIAKVVGTYVTGYLTVITTALTVIGKLVGTGFAVLRALTTGDTRALRGRVSSIWRGLKNTIRPVLTWITRDIPHGFSRVKDALSRTLGAIGRFVTTGAQAVAAVIKGPIQGLVAFANWVIDGLNKISFSFFGKKFGIHLHKIPMLAEGGIAVPGAAPRAGRVLPLTALERQRRLAARRRDTVRRPHRVQEFHERPGAGALGTADDLLFLATAHACP